MKVYASVFGDYEFINKVCYTMVQQRELIEKYIVRLDSILALDALVLNIKISNIIEASIFEYTLIYVIHNNIDPDLMVAIYVDKLENMKSNFNKDLKTYNEYLVKQLGNKDFDFQCIAFLEPYEINPKNWDTLIKKKELREDKKNNITTTNLYLCYKCKQRKCSAYQLQTRGADEPMTTFVKCLVCFNEFKC